MFEYMMIKYQEDINSEILNEEFLCHEIKFFK